MTAPKRSQVMQKVDEAAERLRASTGIEYRPVKKLIKGADGYGKVVMRPSPKMIEKLDEQDQELTMAGYRDCPQNVDLTYIGA